MFDFRPPFVADELNDDFPEPVIYVLMSVDWSVDPFPFKNIPVNRVELP